MKIVIAILLMNIALVNASGVQLINIHYCFGLLKTINADTNFKSCSDYMYDEPLEGECSFEQPSCCYNIQVSPQFSSEVELSSADYKVTSPILIETYLSKIDFFTSNEGYPSSLDQSPPLPDNSLPIMHQALLL